MAHRRSAVALAAACFLGCAAAGGVSMDAAVAERADAQEIDEAYFYTSLAPQGAWVQSVEFGWVWHPAGVAVGWRPYTVGHWVWTDAFGWTWASYEPWGWATYHYGRWYFDPYYGWSWVPGFVWAPAWVSWRIEPGFIGWAPLWPGYFDSHRDRDWDHHRHGRDWNDRHHGRDWDRWVFTRDRDFTSPRVGRAVITDRETRMKLLRQSRELGGAYDNRPDRIGRSLNKATVEKALGRPIHPAKVEMADRPARNDASEPDRLRMFRPRVKERPGETPDRLGVAKPQSREVREQERRAWDNAGRPEPRVGGGAPHEGTASEPPRPHQGVPSYGHPSTGDRGNRPANEDRSKPPKHEPQPPKQPLSPQHPSPPHQALPPQQPQQPSLPHQALPPQQPQQPSLPHQALPPQQPHQPQQPQHPSPPHQALPPRQPHHPSPPHQALPPQQPSLPHQAPAPHQPTMPHQPMPALPPAAPQQGRPPSQPQGQAPTHTGGWPAQGPAGGGFNQQSAPGNHP